MKTTTLIDGESSGTSAADGLHGVKHALESGGFTLTATVTNSANGAEQWVPIQLRYFTSPIDMTVAEAQKLRTRVHELNVKPSDVVSGVSQAGTDVLYANGPYLYVWYDVPQLDNAVTLHAYVLEI